MLVVCHREKSYSESVKWYQKATETTVEDECGEYDATMDDPVYQLKATLAELYLAGGFGLDKDPSYAGLSRDFFYLCLCCNKCITRKNSFMA